MQLVKISTLTKLTPGSAVYEMNENGLSNKWAFNNKNFAIIPFCESIYFQNGNQVAQIDLRTLSSFPQYQHHVHTKTFNQQFPFTESAQTDILIDFLTNQNPNQNFLQLKLTFIDAEIQHDTQFLAKMSPYVKVLVNNKQQWRSKTAKKGDKHPNFNQQNSSFAIDPVNDIMRIQIWDDDFSNDDLIGGVSMKGIQFIGRNQQILQYIIEYSKKGKPTTAGKIRFKASTSNFY